MCPQLRGWATRAFPQVEPSTDENNAVSVFLQQLGHDHGLQAAVVLEASYSVFNTFRHHSATSSIFALFAARFEELRRRCAVIARLPLAVPVVP